MLLGLGISTVAAQAPTYPIHPDFLVKHWTVEDGLPVNAVTDIAQTHDGYLWMTTLGGLVRFDGQRFTVFTSSTSPSLISNRLEDLHEDTHGNLWIRMGHGDVVRYRDGVFTAFDQTNGLPGRATGVFYDDGDTFWILTDRGLARYDNGAMQPYRPDLIRGYVTALLRDQAGNLWVSTYSEGLVQIQPSGLIRHYTVADGLPEAPIRALYEDRDGQLWVGTEGGVVLGRGERFEPLINENQPWTQPVYTIQQDPTGTLWFGGEAWWSYQETTLALFPAVELSGGTAAMKAGPAGSLWRVQGSWLYRDDQPIYRADLSHGFAFDPEGNIWLGTDQGLFQLRRRIVHSFSEAEGLPGRNLYPILEDRNGAIWLGTSGQGLARLDGETLMTYELGTSAGAGPRPNTHVLSLYQDRQGTLWVGRGGVLCHMLGGRCAAANIPLDPVLYEDVQAIHEDREGRFWLGTAYSGLLMGQPAGNGYSWTHFSTDNGLTSNWVRVIVETGDGDLLLGTNGGGIMQFVPPGQASSDDAGPYGTFEPFSTTDGFAFDNVRDIYEDRDGFLWIATENQGLCRLDRQGRADLQRGEFVCIDAADGLFDNTIHRILEDDAGRFWMSSNRGLFWVDRAELNAFATGAVSLVTPVGYTEHDGMRNRQANGGVQPAGIKASDGRLWFPTQDGAAIVDPAAVRRPEAPPVVIEAVRVGDKVQRPTGTLVLAPGERNLDIDYTALAFTRPTDVRFRYKLEGHNDDTWQKAGIDRRASYSNLPPGTYTFRVAAGLGGTWSEEDATLTIERQPYVWETTWFLVLCGLLGGLGVFGFYRYRLRQVETRNVELEQKVTERTAQIRENQAQLEKQADELRRANELKSRFLTNISHEFRTPLTLTLGPLEDLQNGRHGSLSVNVHTQLGLAHRNARRLLRLINQLLDLSKLEAGALVLHLRRYDLTGFLHRLTYIFDGLAQARHITLRFDAPDAPLTHIFDADKLEKVVLNLLSNAFKFTPERGTIHVGLQRTTDGLAIIKVADNGTGIPAEHLPHLFDRFYQADSATTRKHEGTGIGLALIKELVTLHGGTITVDSTVDQGTTFTVTLPEASVPEEGGRTVPALEEPEHDHADGMELPEVLTDLMGAGPPEQTPTAPPAEDAILVLVVEDNADMRAYLRVHLEDTYLVAEAVDGAEGLERALELVPDLVVSDVMMPEMDGYGLCQALKTDERTSHIPVVLLTAKADMESRIEGFETGADAYLAKPFNATELRVRVRMLIEQRRKLRELYIRKEPLLGASEIVLQALDVAFLEQVRQTIEARLSDPDFGVDMLAEAAGMSRRQLLRKLKALTGEKPNALIRRMRLERAAQMLRQQAGSVKEIAYAVGFRSTTHFSKIFQETHGTPPTAYAEQHALRSNTS